MSHKTKHKAKYRRHTPATLEDDVQEIKELDKLRKRIKTMLDEASKHLEESLRHTKKKKDGNGNSGPFLWHRRDKVGSYGRRIWAPVEDEPGDLTHAALAVLVANRWKIPGKLAPYWRLARHSVKRYKLPVLNEDREFNFSLPAKRDGALALESARVLQALLSSTETALEPAMLHAYLYTITELLGADFERDNYIIGAARAHSNAHLSAFVTAECSRALSSCARALNKTARLLRELGKFFEACVDLLDGSSPHHNDKQPHLAYPDEWAWRELRRLELHYRTTFQDAAKDGLIKLSKATLECLGSKSPSPAIAPDGRYKHEVFLSKNICRFIGLVATDLSTACDLALKLLREKNELSSKLKDRKLGSAAWAYRRILGVPDNDRQVQVNVTNGVEGFPADDSQTEAASDAKAQTGAASDAKALVCLAFLKGVFHEIGSTCNSEVLESLDFATIKKEGSSWNHPYNLYDEALRKANDYFNLTGVGKFPDGMSDEEHIAQIVTKSWEPEHPEKLREMIASELKVVAEDLGGRSLGSQLILLLRGRSVAINEWFRPARVYLQTVLDHEVARHRPELVNVGELACAASALVYIDRDSGELRDSRLDAAAMILERAIGDEGVFETSSYLHTKRDGGYTLPLLGSEVLRAYAQLLSHVEYDVSPAVVKAIVNYFDYHSIRRVQTEDEGDDAKLYGWTTDRPRVPRTVWRWATCLGILALRQVERMIDDRINRRVLRHFNVRRPSQLDPAISLETIIYPDYGLASLRTDSDLINHCLPRDMQGVSVGHLLQRARSHVLGQKSVGDPCYSMLLFGPPGTGKTTFLEALARSCDCPLVEVTPSDLISSGQELLERRARVVFEALSMLTGAVVLFDEFDPILRSRVLDTNKQQSVFSYVTPGMLPKLKMLNSSAKSNRVVFALNTNQVGTLDEAAIRSGRFDFKVGIFPPDVVSRAGVLVRLLRQISCDEDDPSDAIEKLPFLTADLVGRLAGVGMTILGKEVGVVTKELKDLKPSERVLGAVKEKLPEKSFIRDLLEAATVDDHEVRGRRVGSRRSPQDDTFGPDADPSLPRRGAGQYFDYESRQWAWVILSDKKTASIAKIASGWTHLAKVSKRHALLESDPKTDSCSSAINEAEKKDRSTEEADNKDAWKNICELVRNDLQDVNKDMIEDLIESLPWRKMRIGGEDSDSSGAGF